MAKKDADRQAYRLSNKQTKRAYSKYPIRESFAGFYEGRSELKGSTPYDYNWLDTSRPEISRYPGLLKKKKGKRQGEGEEEAPEKGEKKPQGSQPYIAGRGHHLGNVVQDDPLRAEAEYSVNWGHQGRAVTAGSRRGALSRGGQFAGELMAGSGGPRPWGSEGPDPAGAPIARRPIPPSGSPGAAAGYPSTRAFDVHSGRHIIDATSRSMQLYFAGAEVASHFAVLKECGVTRVAVSASNLARVAKDDKLTLWASRARLAGLDWVLYADSVHTPVSTVTTVLAGAEIQPEAVAGPIEWYDTTWLKDSDLLFLPSWDGTDPAILREYVEDFDGVVLPDAAVDNPTTVRAAKAALPRMGTLAALTGRTKGLERFDMLLSSSWWAVQKHGETQVWTGDRFVRLNADDKHLKRQKYADAIAALGVDVDKVLADDPNETLRLAVKSWLRLEEHIAAGRSLPVSQGAPLVTSHPSSAPSNVVPISPPVARAPSLSRHQVLPVISTQRSSTTTLDANGNEIQEVSDVLTVSPVLMQQCNTCSLQIGCPSFQPHAPCSYQIPVSIKNKAELEGVMRAIAEIQTQRILMGRFGEQIRGEPDALLGIEMDRLARMVKTWREISDNRDSLKLTIDAKGQAGAQMGVLSRLFGEKAGQNAMRLEHPIDAEEIIDQMTGEDEDD